MVRSISDPSTITTFWDGVMDSISDLIGVSKGQPTWRVMVVLCHRLLFVEHKAGNNCILPFLYAVAMSYASHIDVCILS
jgi:hypothetical protein